MGRSFGIVLMLVNPAWQEMFSNESHVFVSRVAREVWIALICCPSIDLGTIEMHRHGQY